MKTVSDKDKLFFFERHFLTLDGLWMIETENELGWDKALKIDTEVWKKLLKIIIRRLKEYLEIQGNSIGDLLKILTFRWIVEGWEFDSKIKDEKVVVQIEKCPYKSAMSRNPERHHKVPLICQDMCIPFYKHIIEHFNPNIRVERNKYMGLGDIICNFELSYRDKTPKLVSENVEPITKVSDEDKLFYFERNFKTLDGLWIIELEEESDFQTSVEIDTVVWQRLYQIIFRRVKRYLKMDSNDLEALIELISFIWSCEGYEYEIHNLQKNEAEIRIIQCPYEEAMKRNPERIDKIETICKDMCIPFYEPALQDYNKNIKLQRSKFLGTGDKYCNFHFILIEY
jgi:predicted hydrocarbon binding protein